MIPIPIIMNPTAGGGRLLRGRGALEAAAERAGVAIEFWETTGPDHATQLAEQAADQEHPLVFAYGGDGTYNEVARGLLGRSTAMAVLPGGTSSVLAYEFGVPRPASRSLAVLLSGEDRLMRVARSDRGDIILLMLSAGPDSHVLERLRPSFKRLGGKVGVVLQALVEAMAGGPLPRIRVASEGFGKESGWVIVGNSRCYGGRFCATPGADPFRPDLEVVVQQSNGRRAAVAFLAGIPNGRHVCRNDVTRKVVEKIRLEPAELDTPVPYQVDGDVAGVLPVEVSVHPESLRVRLPG